MDEQKNRESQDQEYERYGVWVKAGPEEVLEAEDDSAVTDLSMEDERFDEDLGSMDALDDFNSDNEDDLVSLDDFDIEEPAEDADPFSTLVGDEGDDELDLDALSETMDQGFESLEMDEIDEISLDDFDEEDTGESLPELDIESDESEHDFTPEDQGIEIAPEPPLNTISADEEEFLREDEDEATADLQNEAGSAIPSTMDSQEREAFDRIQQELHDIKRELAELKQVLRQGASVPGAERPLVQEEPAADEFYPEEEETETVTEPSAGTGFFEDEEDETIALTGDELDNILNTAEFTEETGETEELDDDFVMPEEESLGEVSLDVGEPAVDDDSYVDEPALQEEDEITLEDEPGAPFVLEGDDSAVDELADMDIDQELAGIESLADETEPDEEDQLDEIELDLDSLDDLDEPLEEPFDLGDPSREEPSDELIIPQEDSEEQLTASQDHSREDLPVDTVPSDEDELDLELDDLDDLDVTNEDIVTEGEDEEGFADFAAAVEQDLEMPLEGDEMVLDEQEDGEVTLADDEPALEIPEEHREPTDEPGDSGPDELTLDEDFQAQPSLGEEPSFGDEPPLDDDFGGAEPSLDDDFGDEPSLDDDFGDEPDLEVPAEEPPSTETPDTFAETPVETDEQIPEEAPRRASIADLPDDLKQEIRSVLSYMDQLLEALPDDKIEEFAQSEHFEVYKHLFEELGLET